MDLLAAAVRENAAWCELVCPLHGVPGETHDGVWVSGRRTPMFYPDAVTVAPGCAAEAVLSRIDTGDGCSVKDSYAEPL